MGKTEVESRMVGEEVMRELTPTGSGRLCSFCLRLSEFKDIDQFMDEIRRSPSNVANVKATIPFFTHRASVHSTAVLVA